MNESVTLSLKSGMEYLLRFCETKSWEIPSDLQSRITELHRKQLHNDLLSVKSFASDIAKYKDDYKKAIIAAILLYPVDPSAAELAFDFAMATAMANIFLSAWVDGGGSLPVNHDSSVWLSKREEQERKYVAGLFVSLALLMKRPDFDIQTWAETRADGYVATSAGIYITGLLRAKIASGHGNELFRFNLVGPDSKESCGTCIALLGKEKTAQEIIDGNLLTTPGNEAFDCLCFRCPHAWINVKTGKELVA
jgi:hypothetical protein